MLWLWLYREFKSVNKGWELIKTLIPSQKRWCSWYPSVWSCLWQAQGSNLHMSSCHRTANTLSGCVLNYFVGVQSFHCWKDDFWHHQSNVTFPFSWFLSWKPPVSLSDFKGRKCLIVLEESWICGSCSRDCSYCDILRKTGLQELPLAADQVRSLETCLELGCWFVSVSCHHSH